MSADPDENITDFLRSLDADLTNPDRWESFSVDQLCQVLGTAILTYAAFTLEQMIPKIIRMYRFAVERVPAERRLQLMQNIKHRFANEDRVPNDSNRQQVDALLPFIVYDPDAFIVASATLDFAVLRGSTEKPWIGVYQAFQMFEQGTVANRFAILSGLIALGDRKLSPKILDLVATMDLEPVLEASKFHIRFVTAATVELCCDWLVAVMDGPPERDPGGTVFGHVAAALARLGMQALEHGVVDISRSFPPPSSQEAVIWHNRWTRPEYARVIEPRLHAIALREREPRVMHDVMNEWGLQFVSPN